MAASKQQQPDAVEFPRDEIEARVGNAVSRVLSRNIPGLEIPQLPSDDDVGLTPKDLVYTRDNARLYHYRPLSDEVYRVPVLFIMSPVAKGYILDLTKGQSLIEYLLMQGHDVYMLEWISPRREYAGLGFENLVCEHLYESVDTVLKVSGEPDITLIGYCMGGVLGAMYAALYPDGPLKNLACFTTPVNADGMDLYKKWVEADAFDIDLLVEQLGVIPAEMVNASIQVLRPLQKTAGQLNLLNNVENDAFVKAHLRFDRWSANQLPFPGKAAREMVNGFLRENKLVNNAFKVGRRTVDLGRITVPFLHVAAEYDHIVPTAASRDLMGLVSSEDKTEIVVKGGHVSLVAGGNAVFRLWPQLDAWLSQRAE